MIYTANKTYSQRAEHRREENAIRKEKRMARPLDSETTRNAQAVGLWLYSGGQTKMASIAVTELFSFRDFVVYFQ